MAQIASDVVSPLELNTTSQDQRTQSHLEEFTHVSMDEPDNYCSNSFLLVSLLLGAAKSAGLEITIGCNKPL